ncbi:hypothetical protein EQG49_00105 [Periweissella cryptocerci]|uniref:Uncharacterized protein n=1 Tax=Periweissella cryptocerci TaxID=2506420 RepID=A0A4P6YQT9_9LACO|nr:hypothetical protein [Periweissella cryptocerci]QBO34956.1 hypothetical protein EQG49_00105 [Periweissella cryptocerci]
MELNISLKSGNSDVQDVVTVVANHKVILNKVLTTTEKVEIEEKEFTINIREGYTNFSSLIGFIFSFILVNTGHMSAAGRGRLYFLFNDVAHVKQHQI